MPSPRINWTAEMERTFLQVLNDGIRVDNGFQKETWMAAESAVKVLCPSLTHHQAKNKHDSYKLKWKAWLDLSRQPDFGWNEVTQLYQASDEVWNLFIAVNNPFHSLTRSQKKKNVSADPGENPVPSLHEKPSIRSSCKPRPVGGSVQSERRHREQCARKASFAPVRHRA